MTQGPAAGPRASDVDWPVFVVSLPDAVDRRARILAQCAGLGLRPRIVDAIDGRGGLPAGLEACVDRERAAARVGRRLSDAELACALSHRAVQRRIVEDGLPGAIVFEDDAILTEALGPFLRAGGHKAAEFVQMDHMDARIWRGRGLRWSPEITLHPLAANASLATGYALSAAGARHVLAHSTPVAGLADWPCDMTALDGVVTWPRLVDHPPPDPDASAIEGGRRALVAAVPPARGRAWRFFRTGYWARWWFKRRTRKIS